MSLRFALIDEMTLSWKERGHDQRHRPSRYTRRDILKTMPKKVRPRTAKRPARPQTKPSGDFRSPPPQDLRPLNFRVPAAFHQEFKMYAVSHHMSMLELLQRAFDRYKETAD
jgi:hypothetical protein